MIARLGDKEIVRAYQGENVIYPTPIRDGLVLWYDFKGKQNTDVIKNVAEDLSGNGNHGELQNFAFTEESGYNNGLVFDGVDDGIKSGLTFTGNNNYTVSLLLSVISFTPSEGASAISLAMVGSGTGRFWIYSHQSGRIILNTYFGSGHDYEVQSNYLAELQTIFEVTIVSNRYKTNRMYINGHFNAEKDISAASDVPWQGSNLYVGRSPLVGGYYGFANINLYSTKVYNRALTDKEIQHNYQIEKERWNLS